MPNGGSDCCGECRFNPASTVRVRDADEETYQNSASCEIRGIEQIARPFYTYCANFHTDSRVPDGPVFAGFHETDRLPWHRSEPVRIEYLTEGFRLAARDGEAHRLFDDAAAYVAWWKTAHPGETAEYPWELHDRAFSPLEGAARQERPSLRQRLRTLIHRDRE